MSPEIVQALLWLAMLFSTGLLCFMVTAWLLSRAVSRQHRLEAEQSVDAQLDAFLDVMRADYEDFKRGAL